MSEAAGERAKGIPGSVVLDSLDSGTALM